MTREDHINYFINHASDLIPYSDPEYHVKLKQMAEEYADYQIQLELDNTEYDYGHNINHSSDLNF